MVCALFLRPCFRLPTTEPAHCYMTLPTALIAADIPTDGIALGRLQGGLGRQRLEQVAAL